MPPWSFHCRRATPSLLHLGELPPHTDEELLCPGQLWCYSVWFESARCVLWIFSLNPPEFGTRKCCVELKIQVVCAIIPQHYFFPPHQHSHPVWLPCTCFINAWWKDSPALFHLPMYHLQPCTTTKELATFNFVSCSPDFDSEIHTHIILLSKKFPFYFIDDLTKQAPADHVAKGYTKQAKGHGGWEQWHRDVKIGGPSKH